MSSRSCRAWCLGLFLAGCRACPAGGPGPASRPRGPPGLQGSSPAPPRGAVPSHRCSPVLQPGWAQPARRGGESSRHILSHDPPFTRRPHRSRVPRPPWGALGGQRHRLSLPASAPAGDPNFGPLIATGRKFPELLPGERGATCLGHTLLLDFSRLVSRGQCLGHLAGTRAPPQPARILTYAGDRVC